MDPVALEKAFEIYPDTRVVVIAHLYGTPGKIDELNAGIKSMGGYPSLKIPRNLWVLHIRGTDWYIWKKYNAISFNGEIRLLLEEVLMVAS